MKGNLPAVFLHCINKFTVQQIIIFSHIIRLHTRPGPFSVGQSRRRADSALFSVGFKRLSAILLYIRVRRYALLCGRYIVLWI